MKLTTPVKIPISSTPIKHGEGLLLMGSCFSENIGKKLKDSLFEINTNSHGILFNPLSILTGFNDLITQKVYSECDLSKRGYILFSYNHHSSFSSTNKNETLELINNSIQEGSKTLYKAKTIVITFGTAWLYELNETKQVVANCHKMPSSLFKKRLLSVNEIVKSYKEIVNMILGVNKEAKIIFTISPVRHIKDGVVENSRSKAILLEAVHQIVDLNANCEYFPSYEVMIDELRDYRYYSDDLLHPSKIAVDYIWNKFVETYFSTGTQDLLGQIYQLKREINHRPLFPNSEEFLINKSRLKEKIQMFNKSNPLLPNI